MLGQASHAELPTIINLLAQRLGDTPSGRFLLTWEITLYSLLVAGVLVAAAFFISRRFSSRPGRLQAAVELIVAGFDDFVCGIIGPQGRRYVPFIGTLFIFILASNLMGLVPFMKSPTSSMSVTLALAACVFIYVHYTAIRSFGFLGYIDHLAGRPRGVFVYTIIFPVMMFILHVVAELVRPMSLSLRLRSNMWGDEMLLGVLARFGWPGLPILFLNMLSVAMTAVIQALVFTLLTTVYFSLVLEDQH